MEEVFQSLIIGDALKKLRKLRSDSVHCCVTSPPYWQMRDYGMKGQVGLEPSLGLYVEKLVEIFAQVRRVLREDGTLWLNLGDTYLSTWPRIAANSGSLHRRHRSTVQTPAERSSAGLKPKDLAGIPWRVALALQADGWYLRSDIIWHKPNPLPESIKDRPTRAHEYLFLFSRSKRYYYDVDAIREPHKDESFRKAQSPWTGPRFVDYPSNRPHTLRPKNYLHPKGKNRRSVWTIPVRGFKGAHFSTFPEKLVEPCILAGSPIGGTVLDPFLGSGTTALVARRLGRSVIGIDLNPQYIEMARQRIQDCQSDSLAIPNRRLPSDDE